ncbi:MAG: aspartate aminotransferase family protein [Longimicrobiales bacterium]|nr:aspartate aminotransferase family protein [Longimicrobiales bacterium]
MDAPLGDRLPALRTSVPGPISRQLTARLQRVESRNITAVGEAGPIFWAEAAGANVRDADGNVYIDLTAGFGVSAAGHGNPAVTDAAVGQLRRLTHAMGDVHPADVKVDLLERLAARAPGELSVSVLSANGSDAVESALKTAVLATGRPGIVAFRGGYHGLGYGALGVTSGPRFRDPFRAQLFEGVRFAPFPSDSTGQPGPHGSAARALDTVRDAIRSSGHGPHPVGAVIVEPVQGRGGIIVPPPDFLPQLRALCDEMETVLILDEVYTGFGRTGRWFACEHWDVVPDLLVVGKSLAGGLPLSALIGRPGVMDAWPASEGEAIHTSTFLGNPVTCAAALAHLDELERQGLVDRADALGRWLDERLDALVSRLDAAVGTRGLGLMRALAVAGPGRAGRVAEAALRDGIIILPEGPALAFTPPLTITEAQLEHALGVIERLLAGSRE